MNVNRISSLVRAKHQAPCTSNKRDRHSNRSTAKSPAATACDPSRPYTATPQWDSRIIPTSFAPSPIAKIRFFSTDFAAVTSSRFWVADTRQNNTDWHCAAARMNSFASYRRIVPTHRHTLHSYSEHSLGRVSLPRSSPVTMRQVGDVWAAMTSLMRASVLLVRTSSDVVSSAVPRIDKDYHRWSERRRWDVRSCWSVSMSCEL